MCTLLLTALMAGAVEVQPGVMQVEYFSPTVDIMRGTSIETLTISTRLAAEVRQNKQYIFHNDKMRQYNWHNIRDPTVVSAHSPKTYVHQK